MTTNQLGVAVVGTGFMGWVHVEALRRLNGVSVVGVLGSRPEKSRSMAERLEIPRAYGSFDELLADRSVHSVHINTPNRLHFTMARRAIDAGKHVLCEKPLALTSAESQQLVRLSHEHQTQAAGVNYNIRYYPMCVEARHRIRSGEMGEVFHAVGSYVQDWLLFPEDYNWRVLGEEAGQLRAVADIGTHWLDLIQWITGLQVEGVCADLQTAHPRRRRPAGEVETFAGGKLRAENDETIKVDTEDFGSVLLRFPGGARGSVHVSQVTAGRKNRLQLEVACSRQSLCWNSETPNEIWIGHRDRANECLLRDPGLLSAAAAEVANYPGGHNEGYADSFKQCFRDFYQYIAEGDFNAAPPYPTFQDGHNEVILCEAILSSHQRRQWVEISDVSQARQKDQT